jgi:hypothetical protein
MSSISGQPDTDHDINSSSLIIGLSLYLPYYHFITKGKTNLSPDQSTESLFTTYLAFLSFARLLELYKLRSLPLATSPAVHLPNNRTFPLSLQPPQSHFIALLPASISSPDHSAPKSHSPLPRRKFLYCLVFFSSSYKLSRPPGCLGLRPINSHFLSTLHCSSLFSLPWQPTSNLHRGSFSNRYTQRTLRIFSSPSHPTCKSISTPALLHIYERVDCF